MPPVPPNVNRPAQPQRPSQKSSINFFLPVVKLTEKVRHGSKVTKKYDKPQTPYQRVLASPDVSAKVKTKLRARYATLNVVQLHEQIEQLVKRLWASGRRIA